MTAIPLLSLCLLPLYCGTPARPATINHPGIAFYTAPLVRIRIDCDVSHYSAPAAVSNYAVHQSQLLAVRYREDGCPQREAEYAIRISGNRRHAAGPGEMESRV
jgi:hypothetical protein